MSFPGSVCYIHLFQMGLETLSAAAFQGLGSLQVLALDGETGLLLDGSLRDHSPQMPLYIRILGASLTCQCANAWVRPWLEWSSRTYMHIVYHTSCTSQKLGATPRISFPLSTEPLPTLEGSQGLRLCLPEWDFEPGKGVADNVAESIAGSWVTLCVQNCQGLHTPRFHLELRLATSLLLAAPYS